MKLEGSEDMVLSHETFDMMQNRGKQRYLYCSYSMERAGMSEGDTLLYRPLS